MIDPEKYTFVIRKTDEDPEEPFVARVIEFPYLVGYGKNSEEALAVVVDAIRILEKEKSALPNPLPNINEFSGRISLRIPKSLHRRLATYAEVEGVSINQYLGNLLSWASENYYSNRQNVYFQNSILRSNPWAQIGETINLSKLLWNSWEILHSKTLDQGLKQIIHLSLSSESQVQELDKLESRPMVNA